MARKFFNSRLQAYRSAKRRHVCMQCLFSQPQKFKECPNCRSENRQYFASQIEFERGMTLLTMQREGTINRLRFQPSFDLLINGRRVTTYRADCDYYQNGVYVVEDSKPYNYMDDLAKVKIALFEAIHKIKVKIPQQRG